MKKHLDKILPSLFFVLCIIGNAIVVLESYIKDSLSSGTVKYTMVVDIAESRFGLLMIMLFLVWGGSFLSAFANLAYCVYTVVKIVSVRRKGEFALISRRVFLILSLAATAISVPACIQTYSLYRFILIGK